MAERDRPEAERTPLDRQPVGEGVAAVLLSWEGTPPARAVAIGGRDDSAEHEGLSAPAWKEAGLSVRLLVRPGGEVFAVEEARGTVGKAVALREDDLVPMPSSYQGPPVRLGRVVKDAELDIQVRPLPPETDEEYMRNGLMGRNEQVGRPVVRLRISEPSAEPREEWLVGGDPWMQGNALGTRDGRVRLTLVPTSESMYRSAVQAIDDEGHVLGEHVVRVNTPFRFDGYEFYQNQFQRPDGPRGAMSVFRVKFDPFIPFIYLGFTVVVAGVVTMLWFPGQRAFKLHAHLARLPESPPPADADERGREDRIRA
jgi:hypothetical protein